MVSAFQIFTFFNCFLKFIFQFILFPSNSLIKESNIFGVFREDTCGTSRSVIESTMMFLALTKFFLCKALSLISLWNQNLSMKVSNSFYLERSYTSMLGSCQLHQAYHQDDMIDHFEMRTSNENSKRLDLTDLRCPPWFWRWMIQGLPEKP